MRRGVARGRVFPQCYSTDRRYGRLSLKAIGLFPLLWANADDQGRLCGDPEELKYICCPNIDHITKADIPGLLEELQQNHLIQVFAAPDSAVIQLLDWWEVQRPQWSYPSEYPAPDGWNDRLRYHRSPTEIVTRNWVPPGQFERGLPSSIPGELANTGKGVSGKAIPEETANTLGSQIAKEPEVVPSPLTTPNPLPPVNKYPEISGEVNITREDEEGRLGSALGSTTSQNEQETTAPTSRMEAEETLCEGDREVISVWRSVKGFKLTTADASALVASLRTEFPDVDLLGESKRWAARKLSEPLKSNSRPSQQIWNWIEMAKKFSQQRRVKGEKSQAKRVTGGAAASAFGQGPWYAGSQNQHSGDR